MAEADVASGGEELTETRLKPLLRLLESCLGKDHMETITRSKRGFFIGRESLNLWFLQKNRHLKCVMMIWGSAPVSKPCK